MEQFINAKIGEKVKNIDNTTCLKTSINHHCGICAFKVQGDHCPKGKIRPACFASERIDRESVFFPLIKTSMP
jgi:hypothetical protein